MLATHLLHTARASRSAVSRRVPSCRLQLRSNPRSRHTRPAAARPCPVSSERPTPCACLRRRLRHTLLSGATRAWWTSCRPSQTSSSSPPRAPCWVRPHRLSTARPCRPPAQGGAPAAARATSPGSPRAPLSWPSLPVARCETLARPPLHPSSRPSPFWPRPAGREIRETMFKEVADLVGAGAGTGHPALGREP